MKLLSGLQVAIVSSLPTAADYTGQLLRTSTGLFYSNGTTWIDLLSGGGGTGIHVGTEPPPTPVENQLWVDTN